MPSKDIDLLEVECGRMLLPASCHRLGRSNRGSVHIPEDGQTMMHAFTHRHRADTSQGRKRSCE
eukprot:8817893-Pyramimonas_sp.AAC.1